MLATITATILLFYFVDMMGLKGKTRKWFGWIVIVSSNLAFGGAVVVFLKRIFVSEYAQQALVDTIMLAIEIGLGTLLVSLAVFMLWRLQDLLRKKGRWEKELAEAQQEVKQ